MGFTDVLKKAFPFISAAASIGGPLGTMAANAVGGALGLTKSPAGTEDSISNAIAVAMGDPTQRAALLKAEQDFQLQMAQLGYQNSQELEAIAEKDRESARQREQVVKDWTPKILAAAVTMGFFGVLAMMLVRPIPDAGHDVFLVLVGSLGTAWTGIIAYYFGSSSGSAAKTEILAAASKK